MVFEDERDAKDALNQMDGRSIGGKEMCMAPFLLTSSCVYLILIPKIGISNLI